MLVPHFGSARLGEADKVGSATCIGSQLLDPARSYGGKYFGCWQVEDCALPLRSRVGSET